MLQRHTHSSAKSPAMTVSPQKRAIEPLIDPCTMLIVATTHLMLITGSAPLEGDCPLRPFEDDWTSAIVDMVLRIVLEPIILSELCVSIDWGSRFGAPFILPTSIPLESARLKSSPKVDPPPRLLFWPGRPPLPPFQDRVPMFSAHMPPAAHVQVPFCAVAVEVEDRAVPMLMSMTERVVEWYVFIDVTVDEIEIVSLESRTAIETVFAS